MEIEEAACFWDLTLVSLSLVPQETIVDAVLALEDFQRKKSAMGSCVLVVVEGPLLCCSDA